MLANLRAPEVGLPLLGGPRRPQRKLRTKDGLALVIVMATLFGSRRVVVVFLVGPCFGRPM